MNKHTAIEELTRQEIIEQLEKVRSLSEMEQQLRQVLKV